MRSIRNVPWIARRLVTAMAWRAGYFRPPPMPPDYEPELAQTIKQVRHHTMTGAKRVAALCDAIDHVVRRDVPGAIVECGVWRGGSMMAAALTLQRLGVTDRELYGFDTFRGMPAPTSEDTWSPYDGYSPEWRWRLGQNGERNSWHYVPLETAREALASTGYPLERVRLVEGMVEETLPEHAPESIALLMLDTDWYRSTRHELEQLWPRLSPGGVLIVDDYGHYEGARRAVEEYFEEHGGRPMLARIDYTGRIGIKDGA